MQIVSALTAWRKRVVLVAKEPKCALAIAIFLYFISAGRDKYVLEGQPMMGVLSWLLETTLTAPQKPLVQIALIIFAIWMFASGLKRIEKIELESAQAQADMLERENEVRRDLVASLLDAGSRNFEQFRAEALSALERTSLDVMRPVSELLLEITNSRHLRAALPRVPTEQSIDKRLEVWDPQMPALFSEYSYLLRQEFDEIKQSLPVSLKKNPDARIFSTDHMIAKTKGRDGLEPGTPAYKELLSLYQEREGLVGKIQLALETSEKRIEELSEIIRTAK